MSRGAPITLSSITAAVAARPLAEDAGQWTLRAGFHSIEPKSGNHALIDVEDTIGLTLTATYSFRPNWSVELLGALPFLHDITLKGSGAAGETTLLESSFGPAAQIGCDIDVIPGWFLNVDARWLDIDSDARLGGVDIGTTRTALAIRGLLRRRFRPGLSNCSASAAGTRGW
ncbi:MAG TPA: OmpW family outer membrane protein [Steroidobacteraceae bacterium]|nr:OmpW family outer membrane protein [Steroidobacteraceae bacterium]